MDYLIYFLPTLFFVAFFCIDTIKPIPYHLLVIGVIGRLFSAVFVSILLLSLVPFSSDVRLPLSDIGDYVEVPDGDVYVVSKWFNRVFRYRKDGSFIATYPYPSGRSKAVHLATSVDNELFFFTPSAAYLVTPDMKIVKQFEGNYDHRTWKLTQSGIPALELERENDFVEHRAAVSGELLVGAWEKSSPTFHSGDGSSLVKEGIKVTRFAKDGVKLIDYSTPLYLMFFMAPFPWVYYGILSLMAVVLRR